MKKSFLLRVLLFHAILILSNANAQEKKTSVAVHFGNAPHDFRIGWYDIDSESFDDHDVKFIDYSLGLKLQRTFKDNISLRLRTSFLRVNIHEVQDKDLVYESAHSLQNKLQIAPGILFSFTQKRLILSGGIEAVAYLHGPVRTEYIHREKQVTLDTDNSTSTIPSGFTAGVAPLMAYAYYLTRSLFIEGEFSMLMLYGKTGGKTELRNSLAVSTTEDSLKGMFFEPRVSIGMGIRF